MPRFFIAETPKAGEEFLIVGEDAHHIARSLRMRVGETLTLCAPGAVDCFCEIIGFMEDGVMVRVSALNENEAEPLWQVTIYQCLPKSDKLEQVIQKSTELGAVRIQPVQSSRCVARMDQGAVRKKLPRWQRIALEAAKQSGRGRIPLLSPPLGLREALQEAVSLGTAIFFYEAGGEPLKAILKENSVDQSIGVFIGPEGGFDPKEAQLAKDLGAHIATLGKRILRTETVSAAVLAMIFYERDDLQ